MKIKIKLTRQENITHYGGTLVEIDMEEYVCGVVASEIGNAALEACKAQAVAARTFALIKHSKGSQITDKSSSDQAFRASRISSSYANVLLATEATAGQVLYYGGKLITTCSYSNSNGGRVKSSEEVWGGARPWLVSKSDPYDNGPGNGHGVGMSQYGAKEMARQGFDYTEILGFYYPGTALKQGYDISKEPEVIKVAYQAKVTAPSGKTVNMRKDASTSSAVVSPIAIGQIVDVTGTTAGEWSQIAWNGKTGYMMTKYLAKVDGSENNNVWYVRIECDSEAQAKAVAQILNKAKAST